MFSASVKEESETDPIHSWPKMYPSGPAWGHHGGCKTACSPEVVRQGGVSVAMTGAMGPSAQTYHRNREGSIEYLLNIRRASWRRGVSSLLPCLSRLSHPGPVRYAG